MKRLKRFVIYFNSLHFYRFINIEPSAVDDDQGTHVSNEGLQNLTMSDKELNLHGATLDNMQNYSTATAGIESFLSTNWNGYTKDYIDPTSSESMKLQDNSTEESNETPIRDNVIQPLKDQVSEVEKIVKAGENCLATYPKSIHKCI